MPGGTGVALGGHDGFVQAARATAFVPAGASVWELSVNQRAASKADDDYKKRKDVPDGSPTHEATYIQLICRPWSKARQWARAHATDGRWQDVRAYNVDRLTTWLEQAPATRLWFLELRGRSPVGVTMAGAWWARWSGETNPALQPNTLLARQPGCAESLMELLRTPGISTVTGPVGADEIKACVVAAAVSADDDLITRTVIVGDLSSWRRMVMEQRPMVLIPSDASFARETDATTHHTVVVPVAHGGMAISPWISSTKKRWLPRCLRASALRLTTSDHSLDAVWWHFGAACRHDS